MDHLEKLIDRLEKDDRPSAKEIRSDIDADIQETKNHILSLRKRLGELIETKRSSLTANEKGADAYNDLMQKALDGVTDNINKSTKILHDRVSDIYKMSEKMNH